MKNITPATLLIKHSAAYILTNGLVGLIALLVIPLFTWKLSPQAYGLAGIYLTLATIVSSSIDYRFLVQKSFVHASKPMLSQTMVACVIIYLAGCLFYMLLGWNYWHLVEGWLPLSRTWVLLACLNGFMLATLTLGFALWQISRAVRSYCFYKFLLCLLNAMLALSGLYYFAQGWESLAWASLLSVSLTLIPGLWQASRTYYLTFDFSADMVKKCAAQAVKFIPYKLSLILFYYSGPLLVVYYAGLQQGGYYLLASQFGNIVILFSESILLAIVPSLVAAHVATPRHFSRPVIIMMYTGCIAAAGLFMAVAAPVVIRLIFPEAYVDASAFVGWTILACCFHGMTRIMQELILLRTEKSFTLSAISLSAACVYIFATMLLLQQYGGVGGAMGLAVGHAVWVVFMLLLSCVAFYRKSAPALSG